MNEKIGGIVVPEYLSTCEQMCFIPYPSFTFAFNQFVASIYMDVVDTNHINA